MNDMHSLQEIKARIQQRFQTDPNIHVNISLQRPRLQLQNVEAKITGVYAHIFQIEEASSGQCRRHTLQYADVLLHSIDILELHDQT